MEAIGDITASAEVSRVRVEGEDFESRIQGGVLVRAFTLVQDRRLISSLWYLSERRNRWFLVRFVHCDAIVYFRPGETSRIKSLSCSPTHFSYIRTMV